MERELLERMLDEGLSLAVIGRRLGRHESTVAYWLAEHGLRAANADRHAARGGLAREQLEPLLARGLSIAQLAQELGRSKATVRHWLRQHGLQTTGRAGRRPRPGVAAALQAGAERALISCPEHGLCEHVREAGGYYRCLQCRRAAVVQRRRRVKEALVAEAGGCCLLCGYSRCPAALEFHHLDPATKEFGLAQAGVARSLDRMRAEARKCVLLCSNCHAEVEVGFSSASGLAQKALPG